MLPDYTSRKQVCSQCLQDRSVTVPLLFNCLAHRNPPRTASPDESIVYRFDELVTKTYIYSTVKPIDDSPQIPLTWPIREGASADYEAHVYEAKDVQAVQLELIRLQGDIDTGVEGAIEALKSYEEMRRAYVEEHNKVSYILQTSERSKSLPT